MKSQYVLLAVVIQGVCGQLFSVEPQAENVAREGDQLTLECVTRDEVNLCAWKLEDTVLDTTGFLTTSAELLAGLGITAVDPASKTDCSITIDTVMSKHNGKYICSPYTKDGQRDSIKAEVVIAQKPAAVEFTGPQAVASELTVVTDQPTSVTCEARDARPKAELRWFLGDEELFGGATTEDETDPGSQLVTSRSTLTHQFVRQDDGAVLRCEASHLGYAEEDERDVSLTVMVQYAPYRAEGADLGTLYGYPVGEEKVLVVNFTANPQPSEMVWTVGQDRMLGAGEQTEDGRFMASALETVNAAEHQYALRLTFQPVQMEDQDTAFQLRLVNALGEQALAFRVGSGAPPPPSPSPPPAPEGNGPAAAADGEGAEGRPEDDADNGNGGVGGAAIGGIIVAVIVLLAVIAIVAFGRSRGKWCFAAEGGGETRKEWRAHMDPEAGNKEGHDNPGHDQKPDAAPAAAEHRNGTNGTNGKTPTDTPV